MSADGRRFTDLLWESAAVGAVPATIVAVIAAASMLKADRSLEEGPPHPPGCHSCLLMRSPIHDRIDPPHGGHLPPKIAVERNVAAAWRPR